MGEGERQWSDSRTEASSDLAPELLGILSGGDFDQDALALAEQSAGVGVWSIDLTTGLVRATAQFFRILGLPPTRERVPMELVRTLRHPDDRERVLAGFRRALEQRTDAYEMEYRIVRPDGETRWIFGRGRIIRDRDGKPLRYSGIDLDITDRKRVEEALATAREELERINRALEERVRERTAALEAEAQRRLEAEARLHQAQKMEAVGQLTGGVAHDFNNILQVIQGNLELAKFLLARESAAAVRSKDDAEMLSKAIDTAQKSSRSASQLVQRLLAFSRQQTLQPTAIDVNRLVDGMTEMIARTLGETIRVETRLAPGLWAIHADRSQLETALLNLVVNARDAMPHGGSLTIETANVERDERHAGEFVPGAYVMLNVADTGCGIPEEILGKVFEPFFTTKDTGKGSGLGLSMVYGFVKQSGGYVRIRSTIGDGTAVAIYLPRSTVEPGAEPDTARDDALPRARPGETVLLVEDNDDIRRLSAISLEGLGYRVLLASEGASALRTIKSADGERIDLLFADIALPGGMSGSVLADTARTLRPRLRVLLTSGYAVAEASRAGVLPKTQLLDKPYTIDDLARSIRHAIDFGAPAEPDVK